MSSLPLAQYCGEGARLGNEHAAGRAALLSTAMHAISAGDDNAAELYNRLSEAEQADVDARHYPVEVKCGEVVLRAAEAMRELTVMLDQDLASTPDPDKALTIGHLDLGWIVDGVAYVLDIKATRWTVPDGPASLQLHAYGHALADMYGCDSYVPGLWFADVGHADWGEPVELLSEQGESIAQRIIASAGNTEISTGPHCSSCYGRMHCKEYVLPAAAADTWLAPLAKGEITQTDAPVMLQRLEQAKDVVKAVESALKVYAEREGGIPLGDKVWKPVQVNGRKSLNRKLLDEKYPGAADECMVQGKAFSQFRKVKA
jgi:hypothetical protein